MFYRTSTSRFITIMIKNNPILHINRSFNTKDLYPSLYLGFWNDLLTERDFTRSFLSGNVLGTLSELYIDTLNYLL